METKKCTRCKEDKLISEYSFKIKIKGIRKPHCKLCDVIIRKDWYISNKDRIINNVLFNNKKIKLRNYQFIWKYLLNNPCIDCGEKNPIVLEFDHRDRSDKINSISAMSGNASIKNLVTEIAKCDVRCCNCHRIRTANQFNWFSYLDNEGNLI